VGIPVASSATPPAGDQANAVVTGAFTATPATTDPFPFWGWFNAVLSGTFAGTAVLQKSFDGGVTYVPATPFASITAISATAAASFLVFEPEQGVVYRWSCTAFTSGTINARISTTGGAARPWVPNS
jgi:uncharacterized membrane protein